METAFAHAKKILNKYLLRAKKSLGQNFLIDDQVIANIITGSGLEPGEAVLEIGPGTGVLTRALSKVAGQLWAVELDNTLSRILQDDFKEFRHVKVIHADALKFEIKDLDLPEGTKLRLVANLPYYITSPLINHFLDQRQYLKSITAMVQQEVAQRIVAGPGTKDYGILSLAVQAYCQANILFKVPPGSFLPPPKVHSAVIRMDILDRPKVNQEQEQFFFSTVKAAFGQRRKTLANSMSQGLNVEKEKMLHIIEGLGISPQARAENLTINDFIKLSEALWPLAKQGIGLHM